MRLSLTVHHNANSVFHFAFLAEVPLRRDDECETLPARALLPAHPLHVVYVGRPLFGEGVGGVGEWILIVGVEARHRLHNIFLNTSHLLRLNVLAVDLKRTVVTGT